MGFDGLFFGRLDYADRSKRLDERTMEMIWKGYIQTNCKKLIGGQTKEVFFSGSDSLGESSWLFTGAMYNGYGPPGGFCFDIFCGDEPINDNPKLHDYNVQQKVDSFISAVNDQVSQS